MTTVPNSAPCPAKPRSQAVKYLEGRLIEERQYRTNVIREFRRRADEDERLNSPNAAQAWREAAALLEGWEQEKAPASDKD